MPFRDAFPILEVSDVETSLSFYTLLLGFEEEFSYPGEDGRKVFASLQLPDGTKLAIGGPKESPETGSIAIWLYTDDVDAEFERLTAADVKVIREPQDQPWGERQATITDPDGYAIHIGAKVQQVQ